VFPGVPECDSGRPDALFFHNSEQISSDMEFAAMDRKSLFTGMCLGAAIAFSGMILGGLGQNQGQGADGVQHFDKLTVGELQVQGGAYIGALATRKVSVVNPRGLPMIELYERNDLGMIEVKDANRETLVRISGILRGGGHIQTLYSSRPAVEIGSSALGGMVTVRGLNDRSGGRMWIMQGNGGTLALQDHAGETTTILPGMPAPPEETEENGDAEDPNNNDNN